MGIRVPSLGYIFRNGTVGLSREYPIIIIFIVKIFISIFLYYYISYYFGHIFLVSIYYIQYDKIYFIQYDKIYFIYYLFYVYYYKISKESPMCLSAMYKSSHCFSSLSELGIVRLLIFCQPSVSKSDWYKLFKALDSYYQVNFQEDVSIYSPSSI